MYNSEGRGPEVRSRDTVQAGPGWMSLYIKEHRGMLFLSIGLSVLAFIFASALMFTSGYMISLAAALPLTVLALHIPSIFVRIFGLGKPFLSYSERLVSHNWVLRMTSHMRVRLYDALSTRFNALSSKERLGALVDLLTDDIGHAQDLYLRGAIPLASSSIIALIVVCVAGAFSWQLGLLFVAFLGVMVVLLPLLSIFVNGARMARSKGLRSTLYHEAADGIYGMADWILAGRQQELIENMSASAHELNGIQEQIRRYGYKNDLVAQTAFCFAAVVLLSWTCVTFGDTSILSNASFAATALASIGDPNAPAYAPNWIAAFVLAVFPLAEALMPASHAALSWDSQRASLKHLDRFSAVSSKPIKEVPLNNVNGFDLVFDSVSFGYEQDAPCIVEGLDLTIPEGTVVALLGRSGSGKTTLATLIHGDVRPCTGRVMIGGQDAFELADDITALVGIIRQDPFLFNLTLRDNLKIADPGASDELLIEALEKVGLGSLLKRLPKGLDTIIEANGLNFSGGEKQRIALARILLADQPIVILDEPFVGIDPITERGLIETMLMTLAGKTIIVITHHLQNIRFFDQVIFLEKDQQGGQQAPSSCVFSGAPKELEETNAHFQKLLQLELD